jgi:sulfide:quinone oxidoreductase
VAPVTRTIRGIRSELVLGLSHGLRAASVANCDNLQTIPKAALGPHPIGKLPTSELVALDRAIRFAPVSATGDSATAYPWGVTTSVLVLGAGFGGLELSSRLSQELGDQVDITLIDRADAFVFGFSKLDVMFGKRAPDAVRLSYRDITTPHVRFRQETITAIDPVQRRVTTDLDAYETDFLVVALGADYELAATPGLVEAGSEFYTVAGAEALRGILPSFERGTAIVGVCGAPFKCPPAPSEAALLLDEFLRERKRRDDVRIQVVIPFGTPIPPSPATSEAILQAFAERGIEFLPDRRVAFLDPDTNEAVLDDGRRLPYDLFLGIPVHVAPAVVQDSGLTVDGWIPVEAGTLATGFPGVYAVGDVTSVGTPKAGVFAERQASAVADHLIARIRGANEPPGYDGTGTCYIEFGGDEVGRVDVDFFSTPGHPTGTFVAPSAETAAEKATFASTRRARWFGSSPA